MAKRHTRDDVDQFHDHGIYLPNRTLYVGSESTDESGESGVDARMAEKFIKNLAILEAINQEPITIIMNNPGGDWYHGIAIYDAIKAAKSHVTIQVMGMAMSMGAVILQAADERIISPSSKFMIHYGTMGLNSTHSKIFDKWSDENKRLNLEMEQILLDRIHDKHPTFKLRKLKELLNFDTILTASETVRLGLADKVLGETQDE